jgi:hypothetical protein
MSKSVLPRFPLVLFNRRISFAFAFGEGPKRTDLFISSPEDIVVGTGTGSSTCLVVCAVVGWCGNLANSAFYLYQLCNDSFNISRHFGQKSSSRMLRLRTNLFKSSNRVPVLEDRGSLYEGSCEE